jgi:hypothetical protein
MMYYGIVLHNRLFFCSTLSELENFLLCERILINVKTKHQANCKNFKRFEARGTSYIFKLIRV